MPDYCPAALPGPVTGLACCYVIAWYVIDDQGAMQPDGWYNFTTGGKTPTAEFSAKDDLRPTYRPSPLASSPDYKQHLMPIPVRVLSTPSAMIQVYTMTAAGDRGEFIEQYPAVYVRAVVGAGVV